jgi:CheY-like chemotaxis protein
MPEKDAIHERLLQIQKASNRAKALVQQILTYSRHAEFALTPLAVDEAVKDSVALIRSSLPPRVDLVCEEFETAYVAADVTQMHQVVLNLCVNASQAIGDQAGTITVSVSTLDTSRSNGFGTGVNAVQSGWSQMWIGSLTPRRYCCIRVADTGCGMSRQTMARIFEPFFTTKEVGTGTGLGLAAVHGILRNHDAVVAVSSRVGIGTVFEIYLPLCDERDVAVPEPFAANKDANLAPFEGDERILLVDDDRALLDATTTALLRRGYDVVAFTNAEEALASFRRAPGTWDIVVTDRSMPRLSGEQLAHEIRQLRPDIPIIMATGFGDAADEKRARQIGINEFIFKPISNIDLMVAIRRALTGPAQQ